MLRKIQVNVNLAEVEKSGDFGGDWKQAESIAD
jgi:hypothetical protein